MNKIIIITHGGKGSGNFGHKGRKGKVGGSANRDMPDDRAKNNVPPGWEGIELNVIPGTDSVKEKVYIVHKNAHHIMNTELGAVAISVRGEYKGEVLFCPSDLITHDQMIISLHGRLENEDNWVRFIVDNGTLVANIETAAVVVTPNNGNVEEAVNNIYKASDYLYAKGVKGKTPLVIEFPSMYSDFDNIETTVKNQATNYSISFRIKPMTSPAIFTHGGRGSGKMDADFMDAYGEFFA